MYLLPMPTLYGGVVGFLDFPHFCPFLGPWACLVLLPAGLTHWALFLSWAFMAHSLLSCFSFSSSCSCGPACCHFLPSWHTGFYFFISFWFGLLWHVCFCLVFQSFFSTFLCLLLDISAVGPLFIKKRVSTLSHIRIK